MNENILATAARLSDDALLARIKLVAIRECDATVELVALLAELEGRQSHLGEGPSSLYKYCRDVLGYSEDAAWNRAATAGAVRRYPVILDWLADGSLNITTVRILRPRPDPGEPSPVDRAPHTGTLSGAVHGLEGDARQAATGTGPALSRDPGR